MSPTCEAFIRAVLAASDHATGQAAGLADWGTAYSNLDRLNMFEILRALAALDPLDLDALWAQHAGSVISVNMPRIEYAYNVVHDRHLPATAPGDLQTTGQVGEARTFLANPTPLSFESDFTGTLPAPSAAAPTLGEPDFVAAAARIHVEVAAVMAVAQVEAGGRVGFGADGRPVLRYELHIFSGRTGGIYTLTHPHLSQPTLAAGNRFHDGTQENEWSLLYGAMILRDETGKKRTADAVQSASWGMFQVMGFNYAVDWTTPEGFADDMFVSEAQHLRAFLGFVRRGHLEGALATHDWATFAANYNGADFAVNHYDQRIGNAYTAISANLRARQPGEYDV